MTTTKMDGGTAAGERLSALMDGELEGHDVGAGCDGWRDDAEARRCWHAYHLIGDVLRSEDLATGRDDAAFLVAIRSRLAREPVVLAPAPLDVAIGRDGEAGRRSVADAVRRAPRWAWPSAVAAGFVLAVGAFTLTRPADAPRSPAASSREAIASADGPGAAAAVVGERFDRRLADTSAAPSAIETVAVVAPATDPRMIRDARLELYLAAHKSFAGTSALGVPSAFLRSATVDAKR